MRKSLLSLLTLVAFVGFVSATVLPQKPKLPSKYAVGTRIQKASNEDATKGMACVTCTLLVDGIQTMLKKNKTDVEIEDFIKNLCIKLKIEMPHVCNHIVDIFADELIFVLERAIFTPAEICGAFVKDCGTSENPLNDVWPMSIPGNKPPVKAWPTPQANSPTLRVLHLSDIHIDRLYAEGSEARCDDMHPTFPFCCQNFPTTRGEPSKAVEVPAGKWGMPYKCDIPFRTFENAMEHISKNEKLDYIIITGDMEAHNIWDYSKDLTKTNIANITATLLKYFPHTPIWEAVGNHEGVPMDAMAAHTIEQYDKRGPQWLYKTLANAWGNWLPQSVIPDVVYRASYAIKPFPGLKLISINTVYCSAMNFYNYINQVDPDGTLKWLVDQLLDSESKGEKVHIISHIPAGASYCLKGWAHNFYEIVNRFENTIAAQFYGHTHQDHFQVYYENSDPNGRATHFNFITPSLTTFDYNNPAYRIYTIDGNHPGSTFTVIDADTYTTDLLVANKEGKAPVWKHEYSARKEYGMNDLSPSSWNDLIHRFQTDEALFKKFHRNYYRSNHNENNCGAACKKKFICEMKSAKSYEEAHFCKNL